MSWSELISGDHETQDVLMVDLWYSKYMVYSLRAFFRVVFCLGTEVPRLSALGVGPTVRGTSEVQSAQEWKCKVHNSILQNGGLD